MGRTFTGLMMREKKMDEIITYGVFCRLKNNHRPDKWFMFCGWFTEYEAAQQMASLLRTNGQCTAVKVVERKEG